MFFTFIWGNKVDKIKRNIITNEYEKGGLKMIHLSNFIDALKCTWIRRIMTHNFDISLLNAIFKQDITKYLLDFGNAYSDVFIQNCYYHFWKDVIIAWKSNVNNLNFRSNDIILKPLWYNNDFKIGNRIIFIKQWYCKGVKVVGDILNKNRFLTRNEFEHKYDIENVCILKYTGLCLSVRKIMGDQYNSNNLSNMIYPYIPETAKLLLKSKKGCKDFYLNLRYKDENQSMKQNGILI